MLAAEINLAVQLKKLRSIDHPFSLQYGFYCIKIVLT